MAVRNRPFSPGLTAWRDLAEPLVPVFLALHGAALLWADHGAAPLQWVLVAVTFLLGVVGLAGWRNTVAIECRAWLLLLVTWLLLYLGGGPAVFFALWYFLLSPVYAPVFRGPAGFVYPITVGLGYMSLGWIENNPLPLPVLLGRATVMTVTGLLVAVISAGQRENFEKLAAAKNAFIASVSHQLRTPLTAVVGFTAELSKRFDSMTRSEIEEFASVAHRQATEVAHIVEDLLVAARAQIDQVTVSVEPVDVRSVVESVTAETIRLHELASSFVISGAATALTDRRRLRQILRNLFTNALRHGGPHIEVQIGVDAGRVVVEVIDDGPGVDRHEMVHIFEPYQTFHQDQGVTGSIGLGLFVSRTLAELIGGALHYRRRPGETVFRLELPLSPLFDPVSTMVQED